MKPTNKQYRNILEADKPHYVDNRYAQYEAIKHTFSERLAPYDEQQRTLYEQLLQEVAIQLNI